jgi:hypothetical protein
LERDKNDRTGEKGWWLNDSDLKELTKAWEGVEVVREKWK